MKARELLARASQLRDEAARQAAAGFRLDSEMTNDRADEMEHMAAPELLGALLSGLRRLSRYKVGSGDDGGGYLYDYADERKDGDWVKWDDVKALIEQASE